MGVRHTRRGKQKMMMSDAHKNTKENFVTAILRLYWDFDDGRLLFAPNFWSDTLFLKRRQSSEKPLMTRGLPDFLASVTRLSDVLFFGSGFRQSFDQTVGHASSLYDTISIRCAVKGPKQTAINSGRPVAATLGSSNRSTVSPPFLINRRTAGNHTLVGSRLTARNSSASESKQNNTQPEIPPKKPFGFPAVWSCPPWTRRRRRLTFWL